MTFRVLELDRRRRRLPEVGDVVRAEVNGRGQHVIGTFDGVTGRNELMCWVVDNVRSCGDPEFPNVGGSWLCHLDSAEVIS